MRVIAGSARRLQLKTITGQDTRPTTDRIKETLFNMIQNDIMGIYFLDLFSGSGAIGIEALSRGAKQCIFVESNFAAVTCIHDNLKTTGLVERADVLHCQVMTALRKLEEQNICFHYVFMDPPYGQKMEREVLEYLRKSKMIDPETIIMIETSLDTDLSYVSELGFQITRTKTYKSNKHLFLQIM